MVADHRSEACLRAKYWDEQKSQAEIADELEVSPSTISEWMDKHGIEARSLSESHAKGDVEKLKDEEWLREQYKHQEKSQRTIAEGLGVSQYAVGNWMDKHGIEARSISESRSGGDVEELKNGEWLRKKYINQQKTTYEIADELDVSNSAVGNWMDKHGIEARSNSECRSDGDVEKLKDEEWLRKQYTNQEKSTYEIADELEVSNSSVRRWMDKHGIEARSKSEVQSEGDIRKLKDGEWLRKKYINQEKSQAEIADELDVSKSAVGDWMDKHGIEARSNSECRSDGDVEKLKDGEWLREQYTNQEKSTYEIAGKLNVGNSTVCRWLKRHKISTRSSIIDPERTTHIVRSEWELEVCNIFIKEGVDYNYESLEIEYCEGSTYVPDFVTDEYVIEVKGAYFSEIHNNKNTEREKALAAMESLDERDYVVVGKELPADIHIPWEERSKIRELLSKA